MSDVDRNYYATIAAGLLMITTMLAIFFKARGWSRFKQLLTPPAQYLETRNVIKSAQFVPEAVITTNAKGLIVHANVRTKELFEWAETELWGREVSKLLPKIDDFLKFTADHSSARGDNFPTVEGCKKSGQCFAAEVIIGKWNDDINPETYFHTIIIRDISHRKANEEAKATLQRQILHISSLSITGEYILQSGAWNWDMVNDVVTCSAGFCKIFNVQTTDRLTAAEVISHIYFEDHPLLSQAMHNSMENKVGYDIEFRVVQRNGSKDKVRSIGVPILNVNSKMTQLDGALIVLQKNV